MNFELEFEKIKARVQEKEKAINIQKQTIKKNKIKQKDIELAEALIQSVAMETQNKIRVQLSAIVTSALQTIYDETYHFFVKFVPKRGKTEVEFSLRENGVLHTDISNSVGGGVVDVVSFALRITLWKLTAHNRQINNLIVLDEPMKFLSRDLQEKAGDFLRVLSDKLDIQFFIISHDTAIIESADFVYEVKKEQEISQITKKEMINV